MKAGTQIPDGNGHDNVWSCSFSWEASTWNYKSEANFKKPHGTCKAMIATEIFMTNEVSIQR